MPIKHWAQYPDQEILEKKLVIIIMATISLIPATPTLPLIKVGAINNPIYRLGN